MNLALMQAHKTLGQTKDNPAVGCVIVKNDNVISAASTSINGRPHAEYNAIKNKKNLVKNSNLYVTLEPCSHYGQTPPCVDKIVKNKIKRVFFSVKDPDLRSFDKSSTLLKKNKILVKSGVCKNKIKNFYRSYYKFKKKGLPFITCKLATSKDYYTHNIKKKWITNFFSRGRVHIMRNNHDCIITSVNTVIMDNPLLTCRIKGLENKKLAKFIIDKKLKIPISSKVLNNKYNQKITIFHNQINNKKIQQLKKLKIKTIYLPLSDNKNFNLKEIVIKIKSLGYSRIFLESGINLAKDFLKNNLVDDFYLFVSNKKIGINGRKKLTQDIKIFLKNKKIIEEKVNLCGDKLFFYKLK